MVSKAVKKSGSSSKELTTKVKTQVKAMLKKSSPSSHVKKDINVHVRRITDKMDVDVVVHQVQVRFAVPWAVYLLTSWPGRGCQESLARTR